LGIPYIYVIGIYPSLDPFSNESAVLRVTVLENPDGAEPSYLALYFGIVIMSFPRQSIQQDQFLLESLSTATVELIEKLLEELLIFIATGKISAAPEHKGLIYCLLEPIMTFLNIAVLIGTAGLYLAAFEAIVLCQALIVGGKDLRITNRIDRTGQIVGSVILRDSSELPEGVLQTRTEAFMALREANCAGLPVGVAQDKVVQHVVEGNPIDGDAQGFHPGEIRFAPFARSIDLRKEDLIDRPF
jgi:hypothetical protein